MRHVPTTVSQPPITVQLFSALNQHKQNELRRLWLHATNTHTHALGWLPVQAYDRRAGNDEILTVENNGDCVGWAMSSVSQRRAILKLYQIWVRPDARILEHGRALTSRLQEQAGHSRCWQIEAW